MQYYAQGPSLDFSEEKRKFSRVGVAFFVFMIVSSLASLLFQLIYVGWLNATLPEGATYTIPGWLGWTVSIVSLYVVAAPITYLVLRTVPAHKPAPQRMQASRFFVYVFAGFALMVGGSFVGNLFSNLLYLLMGVTVESPITDALMTSDLWLSILYTGVLAPILEELFFRKFLIDRLNGCGDLLVILTSGVAFGLFHGNFDQFFYATLLGCLLAYVYVRYGKIRYPIIIHAIVNFFGGILPTIAQFFYAWVVEHAATEAVIYLSALVPLFASMLLYAFAVVGVVLILIRIRRMPLRLYAGTVPRGMELNVALGNFGGALFAIVGVIQLVLSLFF